jgi:predicted ATP-dependent protease
LFINFNELIQNSSLWKTLKKTLLHKEIDYRNFPDFPEEKFKVFKKIPNLLMQTKIVFVGSEKLYKSFYHYDDIFKKIILSRAEVPKELELNENNLLFVLSQVENVRQKLSLLPLDRSALKEILFYLMRQAESRVHFSTNLQFLNKILQNANLIAQRQKSSFIKNSHIQNAYEEESNLNITSQNQMIESISSQQILLEVKSFRVGMLNALTVYHSPSITFGLPTRLTCRVFQGKRGITNLDREAALSGRIYNKGLSILTSYLYATFSKHSAISLSASLCFEQNYLGIDGDSASLAELILVLSSIIEIPCDQGVAVTGSVNQFGLVQPVGGINEKIEGFFQVCQKLGLSGTQGVVIPRANLKNLVLHSELIQAIEHKSFFVWPVETVNEAFEIITGYQAGSYDKTKNHFSPRKSAFYAISRALLSEKR